jgi:hypothetical protein
MAGGAAMVAVLQTHLQILHRHVYLLLTVQAAESVQFAAARTWRPLQTHQQVCLILGYFMQFVYF